VNDEELRQRLLELVMEHIDEPVEQRLHHILSAREVAEGMGLTVADVEQLAEAESIPGGYKESDGSWKFSVEAIILFLTGPPNPEVLAEIREAIAASPIGQRALRRWTLEDVAQLLHRPVDEIRRLADQGILTGHCGADGVWTFSYRDVMDYAARRAREA
jgi:hypothetical protein